MLFGFLSQLFFAICLIPQPYFCLKNKTVKNVSVGMWFLQGMGYIGGLFYGISIKQIPLILGGTWGLIWSSIFFYAYFKYKDKN
jgi:uncharacterized protein with PQ loop repeat